MSKQISKFRANFNKLKSLKRLPVLLTIPIAFGLTQIIKPFKTPLLSTEANQIEEN
jgi:hypothetical protein